MKALSGWVRFSLVVVGITGAAACAATRSGGGSGTRYDVLTTDEIKSAQVSTLYEAIERLRPRWLTVPSGPRSFHLETEIVVYQGQTLLGGPDILKQLAPDMVAEIRYLDGPRASAMLPGIGSRHVAGAIVITPR